MKYYKIVDDAYMTHYVAVEDGVSIMLAPYTRQADEISKEEYDYAIKERDIINERK